MKNLESLFAAYFFVWAILFAYHWSVGRRVARLREELERKKRDWES
jgi:CcmD family protein